jgi:hypothetical protein
MSSTLAIWVSDGAHESRDPPMPVRLFAGRCARATREKSACVLGVAYACDAAISVPKGRVAQKSLRGAPFGAL